MSLTTDIPECDSAEPSRVDEDGGLVTVAELRERHALSAAARRTVEAARREFREILAGRDRRFVLIVGPCSIHDPEAALEYADRVRRLRERYGEKFFILMRAYLEKPRTTVGWKGLISDPDLDGSCDLNRGLDQGRRLLCDLAEMGVPAAAELVDPGVTPYIDDLISWASVGARTVESQTHRQLVSGLAMPAGFKNGTQGDMGVAVEALVAARHSHVFPAAGENGRARLVRAKGNPDTHVVLRGGRNGSGCVSNWDADSIQALDALMMAAGAPGRVMVDCSHANSGYEASQQVEVATRLFGEVRLQVASLFGLMLESNLQPGKQKLNGSRATLRPGISITDACLGMDETERLVESLWQTA